jgi:hypothetical protein
MESTTQTVFNALLNTPECKSKREKEVKGSRSKKTEIILLTDLSGNSNTIQYELTYENFSKHNLSLKSYKIPELKACARKYHLAVSGAKPFLIERIETRFTMIKARIHIQRMFRGHIVRKMLTLHGPALKNRAMCSNETDFATMEPITEIENMHFFSYTDKKNFTYGFNVTSLISMMKAKSKAINPYNREKIEQSTMNDIISLHNINCIISPIFRAENEPYMLRNTLRPAHFHHRQLQQRPNLHQNVNNEIITNYNPTVNTAILTNQESYMRYRNICEIRNKPVDRRISELFMEFDQLGNYTNQAWFTTLDYRDYIRLYRNLFEIWNYRGMLTQEVKMRICPFHGPFDSIFNRPIHYNELSLHQIKLACLIAIENLVYSGVDDDSRKIGAFHALSGLTLVSLPARMSLPWLYDSVAEGQVFV